LQPRNEFNLAEPLFLESIRINPKAIDPKLNLTLVYMNLGKWEEANYWVNQISVYSEKAENFKNTISQNL